MGVFDAAVEAIFLCYLVDQEENDGETRPYYASAALRAYMERHRPCYQLPEASPPPEVHEPAEEDEEAEIAPPREAYPTHENHPSAGNLGSARKEGREGGT